MITVLFPTHNEEDNVGELHRRVVSALGTLGEPFEIIAVDDSTDHTKERLAALKPIRVISLAYRMGQTAAIDAGIRAARGELIVIMDADLQNDPSDIPLLVGKMREGYDAVIGWRKERHDSFGRRLFSRFANRVTNAIAGLSLHDYGCALRVFKRDQLADIHLYGVMHVFIPVILASRGARIAEVVVSHHERRAGETKYTFIHMASDIADLLAIKFLYGYAARPLVFFGTWALASLVAAFASFTASAAIKFAGVLGFSQTPLPIIGTLFTILAFLLFMLGFITELLIRIYYEARGSKPYRVAETIENE